MGVRGLFSFIQRNRDKTWVKYELHDTKLVIDGYNLSGSLAQSMDWNPYGGECDKFYQKTKQFFQDLALCKVKCFVIFDGGLQTVKLRKSFLQYQEKLNTGYRLREYPLCYRRIFKQVLEELDIYNVVSDKEADQEMAALAELFNCPILSNDTDFVIYNIKCIPWNFLGKPRRKNGNKTMSMSCVTYDGTMFQKHFGISLDVLPLMSTLVGNDFMDMEILKEFHTKIDACQNTLAKVIEWLKDKSLESACIEFLDMFPNSSRDKIETMVQVSLGEYEITSCRLVESINKKIGKPKPILQDQNNNYVSEITQVENNGCIYTNYGKPEWLYNKVMCMSFPAAYLNLFTWRMFFYTIQFENFNDKDTLVPALPIIRYVFDILHDFEEENMLYVSRQNTVISQTVIDSSFSLKNPKFKSFSICDKNDTQAYFNYFVQNYFPGIEKHFQKVPQEFQLILLSLLWYIKQCNVPSSLAYSLILSYVTVGIVNVKCQVKSFKNSLAQLLSNCHRDFIGIVQENSDVSKIKSAKQIKITNTNQILIDDCSKAKSSLSFFFDLQKQDPESTPVESFTENIRKVHLLIQYTNIIQHVNLFNELLGLPYTCIKYGEFYNGTFVYNVWHTIQTNGWKDFNLKYLQTTSTVNDFYLHLCDVLCHSMQAYGLFYYE